MKVSMMETPIITEIAMMKENSIQGLYTAKAAHESFWTLKAKIELVNFQDHKKEVNKQNE